MTETTSPIQVGQTVPDFKISTFDPSTGAFGSFSLADAKKNKKWTALVFYPADFTFVCATEFSALARLHAAFQSAGAEVVTVSTDTIYTHLAWHREEGELAGVKYPMGADRTGEISRLFGVLDAGSGNALRGSFLISPEGKLTNAEVNFYNVGRNMDELLRKLQANIYLSSHGDEACPASWKQGEKTLKPGAALVGRVKQALGK